MAKSNNQILIVTLICAAAILIAAAVYIFNKTENGSRQAVLSLAQTNLKCSADASWTIDRDSVKDIANEASSIVVGIIEQPNTAQHDAAYSKLRVDQQLKGSFFKRDSTVNLCLPLRSEDGTAQKVIAFLKGTDSNGRWVPVDGWNGVVYQKDGKYNLDDLIRGEQSPQGIQDIEASLK